MHELSTKLYPSLEKVDLGILWRKSDATLSACKPYQLAYKAIIKLNKLIAVQRLRGSSMARFIDSIISPWIIGT